MSVDEIVKQVEDDLVLYEGEGGWVEMGSRRSGHWGHKGRPGKRGGSAKKGGGTIVKVKVDSEVTNLAHAQSEVQEYMSHIPEDIQHLSTLREMEVYSNPMDAEERIAELVPWEDTEGARGMYDRDARRGVSSLWVSEDMSESGRNFYHEYAHSLDSLIVSDGWEKAWGEWKYGQDESFAEAFAEWMVMKRGSSASDFALSCKEFGEYWPITKEVFEQWGL